MLSTIEAKSYETNVHQAITHSAITYSNTEVYLKDKLKINLTDKFNNRSIQEWMMLGSDREDNAPRWLNHFYDPTTGKGLNTGGIIIWGEPSLQWGKDNLLNVWDWKDARDYYHLALTSVDQNTRESAFTNTFRALGQVIHLIQDKAVPAHTRNDAHNFSKKQLDMYEMYTKKPDVIKYLKYDGYPVVDNETFNSFSAFWENNGKGLSEYSNRNFLSRNTNIDDNVYALPAVTGSWTITEVVKDMDLGWINVEVKYLKGYASDSYRPELSASISRLSAYSYFDYEMEKYNYTERVYSLNNFIHKECSDLLIPRAVGYSAGILNYFFRGNIEITLPDSGVYAETETPATGFTEITLRAKNTSANSEQMTDGTIELVVGYRRAIDDPFLNYPEEYPFQAENEITYIAVPEKNGIRSIPSDGTVELTFDLSKKPVPLRAINVFIRLIYHGRLGNEEGAVVVGFKDISEPTPVDFFNDMDQICLNGTMYPAGSAAAIDQVDTNNNGIPTWDVYSHDLENTYFKVSPFATPQYASAADNNFVIPYLNAGYFVRASYILTDYTFSYNSCQTLLKTSQEDHWYHQSWGTEMYPGVAIKNQVEYEENAEVCAPLSAPCHIWWYPTFLEYRGVDIWWGAGIMFINKTFPEGSACDCYQGVLRNCMNGAQSFKASDNAGKTGIVQHGSADVNATESNAQILPLTHKQRRTLPGN